MHRLTGVCSLMLAVAVLLLIGPLSEDASGDGIGISQGGIEGAVSPSVGNVPITDGLTPLGDGFSLGPVFWGGSELYGGKFDHNRKYNLVVPMIADPGHSFVDDFSPLPLPGATAVLQSVAPSKVTVVYLFPELPGFTELGVVGVNKPVPGHLPDVSFRVADERYSILAKSWDGNLHGDAFDYNTAYTLSVTLRAREYTVEPGAVAIPVDGATAAISAIDGRTVKIDYVFECTQGFDTVCVDGIMPPMAGEIPDAAIVARDPRYSVKRAVWEGELYEGAFDYSTYYTLLLELEALRPYAFSESVAPVPFPGVNLSVVSNDGSRLTLRYEFESTSGITSIGIKIPSPLATETPPGKDAASVDDGRYRIVDLGWQGPLSDDGRFLYGEAYSLSVTVDVSNVKYRFEDGVEAHVGEGVADIVSSTGKRLVFKSTFPATCTMVRKAGLMVEGTPVGGGSDNIKVSATPEWASVGEAFWNKPLPGSAFSYGEKYVLTVFLHPCEGEQFSGFLTEVGVDAPHAVSYDVVFLNPGAMAVRIAFPETSPGFGIVYDADGGDAPAPTGSTAPKGRGIELRGYAGDKEGHTFLGWLCGNKLYLPGERIALKEHGIANLKAHWIPGRFTLSEGKVQMDMDAESTRRFSRIPGDVLEMDLSIFGADSINILEASVRNVNAALFETEKTHVGISFEDSSFRIPASVWSGWVNRGDVELQVKRITEMSEFMRQDVGNGVLFNVFMKIGGQPFTDLAGPIGITIDFPLGGGEDGGSVRAFAYLPSDRSKRDMGGSFSDGTMSFSIDRLSYIIVCSEKKETPLVTYVAIVATLAFSAVVLLYVHRRR